MHPPRVRRSANCFTSQAILLSFQTINLKGKLYARIRNGLDCRHRCNRSGIRRCCRLYAPTKKTTNEIVNGSGNAQKGGEGTTTNKIDGGDNNKQSG